MDELLPLYVLQQLLPAACYYPGGKDEPAPPPPTEDSLARIHADLGVVIPPTYVWMAEKCPTYHHVFARIGPDFDHWGHILKINQGFHEEGLPRRYVMFNDGHDGYCDCWNLEGPKSDNEFAIEFLHLSEGRLMNVNPKRFLNFRSFLDDFCRWHAPRSMSKNLRRRAKNLLAEHVGTLPVKVVSWRERIPALEKDWRKYPSMTIKPDWKWLKDGTKLQIAYYISGLLQRGQFYTAPQVERLIRENVNNRFFFDPQFAPDHIRLAMLEEHLIERNDEGSQYWLRKSYFAPVDGEKMLAAVRQIVADHPNELLVVSSMRG